MNSRKVVSAFAQNYFQADSAPDSLVSNGSSPEGSGDLEERFKIFTYGFGARTKIALENQLPKTRKIIGEEDWNKIGQIYARTIATTFENLNDISFGFPSYLESIGQDKHIIDCAMIEVLCLKSVRSSIDNSCEKEAFLKNFEMGGEFLLQPHVYFHKSNFNPLTESIAENAEVDVVVWRSGPLPYVDVLKPNLVWAIDYVTGKMQSPDQTEDLKSISEALNLGISRCWFKFT